MDNYSTPRQMKRIGDFFEKYKTRFRAPQASVENACIEVIYETTGFKLTSEQITYTVSTRTISLQIPSVLKSELRFHHELILQKLVDKLGRENSPKTIL